LNAAFEALDGLLVWLADFVGQPTNHLDLEGLDGLMLALSAWNGGVIVISHDERFITSVAKEVRSCCCRRIFATLTCFIQLWVCGDGTIAKFKGDVEAYKVR
jgi:ATP-binding cassette subfamily F protein 3